MPVIVKEGPDGLPIRREPYDRAKIRRGIELACAKRPIPPAAIDRLVASVEAQIRHLGVDELSSRKIGDMVIAGLHDLDQIAYIRYAIVFLGLDDLAQLRGEIDRLLTEKPTV
jgi:transcriptional repressor NrdR